MFVLTMKFNKKTVVLILIAIAVLLAAIVLIAGLGSRDNDSDDSPRLSLGSDRVKTNSDRVEYLAELGWECDTEPVEEQAIVIPREFGAAMMEYNELQKAQGFDLGQYCGLEVTMYRYNVTNYPGVSDTVHAQLIVHNNRVIGGDIHSTTYDGFMHGLIVDAN